MRNRNLVQAQVNVQADAYAGLLDGGDSGSVFAEVTAAMNRTAAERRRRVFGEPRQIDAVENDGMVELTFEAYTEPA